MFKKIVLSIQLALITLFIPYSSAFAGEMVRGAGILELINIIENVSRDFNAKNPEITVTHKELNKVADVIEAVGTRSREYGLINRPLNEKEKELYPEIQSYLFAKDGIVFVVHSNNPLKSISSSQLKNILQGKITDWSQVGGDKGVISMLTLRDKKAVERVAFEKLILGKEKMAVGKIREVNSLREIRSEVELDKSAIGYLRMSSTGKKVKLLELDGLPSQKADVKAGTYPLNVSFSIITNGEPSKNMHKFMDFLYSPEGAKFVEKSKVSFIAREAGK